MKVGLPRPIHLCVLFGLTTSGCGGEGSTAPNNAPEASGSWSGKVAAPSGVTATLTFNVTETNRKISGSGSLAIGASSLGLSVSGTYAPPTISLTISSQGYEPMSLEGTVSETGMIGTLDGSGFVNRAVTLKRQ